MSQYLTLPKNKEVDCFLLMGILRLNNLACLKEVYIFMCFIVCVMLGVYQRIFWRSRFRKREIST